MWLLRSVPPLVQLLFWYELASLYPQLSLGIPFGHEFVTRGRPTRIFAKWGVPDVGVSASVVNPRATF